MSAGMLVQCSILESPVKNLKESQVKALNGNQLLGAPTASYKNAVMYRNMNGLGNPFSHFYIDVGYSYTSSATTPFEWIRDYMSPSYESIADVYTQGVSSYSGNCGISGAAYYPFVTGYPASFDGSGNPVGTGTIWGAMPSITYGPVASNNFAIDSIDYKASGSVVLTQTLSNLVDVASYFSELKTDIFSQTWDWSVTEWTKSYNSPSVSSGLDISTLSPSSSYDDSIQAGSFSSLMLPFSRSAFAQTGWFYYYPSGGILVWSSGLAKNTTGVTQGYFIARYQSIQLSGGSPAFQGTAPNAFPSGVTYTKYILTLESTGVIQPNQVIGKGQDIDLPVPSTDAAPLYDMGNSPRLRDYYFAVIGEDPSTWAAANGLVFGTNTGVT